MSKERTPNRKMLENVTCTLCKRQGHPDTRFWYNDTNKDSRPEGWIKFQCKHCNEIGHTSEFCFKKKFGDQQNKHNENENGDKECIMCTIKMEKDNMKVFSVNNTHVNDKNREKMMDTMWVADSGESNHITNSKQGLTNVQQLNGTEK